MDTEQEGEGGASGDGGTDMSLCEADDREGPAVWHGGLRSGSGLRDVLERCWPLEEGPWGESGDLTNHCTPSRRELCAIPASL